MGLPSKVSIFNIYKNKFSKFDRFLLEITKVSEISYDHITMRIGVK
jgi:hypothetical protein